MIFFVHLMHWMRRSPLTTMLVALAMVGVALVGNSWALVTFDGIPWGDALYGSVVSITTIGYGDVVPQHPQARLASLFFIVIVGLTAFTLLLGMLADRITDFAEKGRRGMSRISSHDHILIVNFPSAARVRQVIREIQSDASWGSCDIVLLTDDITELPFHLDRVAFVHGSPFESDSYARARLPKARAALILAPNYDDPRSDAVVSSIVAVIENLRAEVYTVAECLDVNHRILFESTRCNAIVCGLQLSSNLLIQELNDPGIAQTMEVISSNLESPTLFSIEVDDSTRRPYAEIAKGLIDRGANLLSVIRHKETFTAFQNLQSQSGDRLVFIAPERWSWRILQQL